MLKLEIKFDDTRMREDRKYAPEAIYAAVDKAFAKYHFPKETLSDGTVCYCGTGMARDYGTFGRIITTLKDKEWFMDYLVKWLWYNSDATTEKMRQTLPWRMYSTTTPTGKVQRDGQKRLFFQRK